jgi:hypothetical protein
MKRLGVILSLAIAHFSATALLFFLVVGDASRRWDVGRPPSIGSRILQGAINVVTFPIVTAASAVPGPMFEGLAGWLPFIANSVLWAFVAYYAVQHARRRNATHRERGV